MAKKVLILAGASGSGKSTLARGRACQAGASLIFSADAYFVGEDGVYRFDPARLPEAHGLCLRCFVGAVQTAAPLVIVDNTNTTVAEVAPYAAVARAFGYDVEIVILHIDPEVAFRRGLHGVPLATIKAQAKRLSTLRASLPPRWPVREIEVK